MSAQPHLKFSGFYLELLLISACRLVMLYICAKFHEINLKRYQSYRVDKISIGKITKGDNSAKNAGGATVVYLCTSSGHALYFY